MPANFTGSLAISGSLLITGSIQTTGGITISGSIASASYALSSSNASNAELLDNLDSTAFVFTSSYNVASSSLSTRVTKIEGNYATTGSNAFNGSQNITGSLTVSQAVIAQTLNVQQVTSSIVYSCGSNIFGCSTSDVQQITGSLRATGSIATFNTNCFGIGTSTPLAYNNYVALTVGDNSTTKTGLIKLRSCYNAGDGAEIYQTSAGTLTIATNGSDSAFRIFSNNVASFTCQICAPQGIFINSAASLQAQFGQNSDATGTQTSAIDIISRNAANTTGFTFRIQNCATTCTTHLVYGGNTVMAFRCDGNVGIGTASPFAKLEVAGGNNLPPSTGTQNYTVALRDPTSMVADVGGSILLQGFKTSNTAIGNFAYIAGKKENGTAGNEAGYLSLGTFDSSGIPAERMRITSAGSVGIVGYLGIGTCSPQKPFEIRSGGTSTTPSQIFGGGITQAIVGGETMLAFSTNISPSTGGTTATELTRAGIGFTYVSAAQPSEFNIGIQCTNVCNSNVKFFNGVERMRITSNGQLYFSRNSGAVDVINIESYTGHTGAGILINMDTTGDALSIGGTGTQNAINVTSSGKKVIISNLGGSGNRAVYSESNGTLTNSSSDITLKKNIENITYGLSSMMCLRPVFYNWIPESLGEQKEIGFIAQEVREIIPEVVGENWNCTLSLDYPKLTAVLTKSIQEQQCQICSQATIIHQLKTCLGMA